MIKYYYHSIYFKHNFKYHKGGKIWYRNNLMHRDNAPALEIYDGSKIWYKDGLRHRLDGPAYEWASGYKAWYIEGVWIKEFLTNKE